MQTGWRRMSARSSASWLRRSISASKQEALLLSGHGAGIVAVLLDVVVACEGLLRVVTVSDNSAGRQADTGDVHARLWLSSSS